jgi:hypothetical protein
MSGGPQNPPPQHTSNSSQSYLTTQQTRFNEPSNQQPSFIWSQEEEESDDKDLANDFYNDARGKSNITDASGYDQYGNAIGTTFDLGRDGAFKDFNILIARFYVYGQFDDKAMQVPINALNVKGFQVKHVKTENECIT